MAVLKLSRSSRTLFQILAEGGADAERLHGEGIHRTQLWKYSTGRSKPDADQIAKLSRATRGKVAADGWETDEESLADEAESKGAA
jgi:hypothetical protein